MPQRQRLTTKFGMTRIFLVSIWSALFGFQTSKNAFGTPKNQTGSRSLLQVTMLSWHVVSDGAPHSRFAQFNRPGQLPFRHGPDLRTPEEVNRHDPRSRPHSNNPRLINRAIARPVSARRVALSFLSSYLVIIALTRNNLDLPSQIQWLAVVRL
jgi:hypothetical protein